MRPIAVTRSLGSLWWSVAPREERRVVRGRLPQRPFDQLVRRLPPGRRRDVDDRELDAWVVLSYLHDRVATLLQSHPKRLVPPHELRERVPDRLSAGAVDRQGDREVE